MTTSARMMTLCSHCGGAWRKKLHPAHTYHCGTRVKLNGMKSSARDRSYPAVSAREVGLLQGRTLQPVRSVLPEGSGYDDIHMRAARKAQKTPWRPLASPMLIEGVRARERVGALIPLRTRARKGRQGWARKAQTLWRCSHPSQHGGMVHPSQHGGKERGRTAEPAHSSCTDASLQLHQGFEQLFPHSGARARRPL